MSKKDTPPLLGKLGALDRPSSSFPYGNSPTTSLTPRASKEAPPLRVVFL
jgi:hypothetical protein